MSHITTATGVVINDLDCLKKAAESCGCMFKAEQKTFKTFAGNQGKCEAAIVHPDKAVQYEIGVNRNADGTYRLDVDNWNNMGGLGQYVGRDAGKLLQHYTAMVAKKQLKKQGYRFKADRYTEEGCLQLVAVR